MAAVDFPSSPTTGQTFTSNGKVYSYNGTGWALLATGDPTVTRLDITNNTSSAITLTGSSAGITIGDTGSVNLYRSASNVLKTDDDFHASKITANGGNVYWNNPANTATPFRISTLGNAWYFVCDSDANNASATNMFFDLAPANSVPVRFMSIGGTARKLNFHDSTGTSDNANLYHTADASTLKSDGNLEVAGTLKVGGNTIQAGAWTTYTPTWTSSSGTPSIGNGTLTGSYCVIGKTVFWDVSLVAGSTTTFGTGTNRFSPPVSISVVNTLCPIGQGILTDSSAGVSYSLFVSQSNSTITALRQVVDPQLACSATSPITMASGDSIYFSAVAEAA